MKTYIRKLQKKNLTSPAAILFGKLLKLSQLFTKNINALKLCKKNSYKKSDVMIYSCLNSIEFGKITA